MKNQLQEQKKRVENPALLQDGKDVKTLFAAKKVVYGGKQEDDIYNSVLYQLEVEKIYLDPKLSLVKFSSIVGTNTTYLSNTVNRRFGVNLKVLVNRYRVVHATKLMQDGMNGIEELAASCGFTSRSVFYASFKREMGLSPRRYLQTKMMRINIK